jgi:hypothetical protein
MFARDQMVLWEGLGHASYFHLFQGPMLEQYPSKLLNTTLQMTFSTIQSFFIALAVERDFSRWKLRLDVGLVAVLYSVSSVYPQILLFNVWPVFTNSKF